LASSPTFPFSHRAACRLIFSSWMSFTHFFYPPPRTPSAGPPNFFYMYATLHFRLSGKGRDLQDSAVGEIIIRAPPLFASADAASMTPRKEEPHGQRMYRNWALGSTTTTMTEGRWHPWNQSDRENPRHRFGPDPVWNVRI
jgi:hypothetical protein